MSDADVKCPNCLQPANMFVPHTTAMCLEKLRRGLAARDAEVARAKAEAIELAAKTCEAMVIGGRAWTQEQSDAALVLFAAAKEIRALAATGANKTSETDALASSSGATTPTTQPGEAPKPGTSPRPEPDDIEQMAREWLRADMLSLYYGAAGATSKLRVASLAALLRARDAATWARACDAIRRENEDALADMLAALGPK